MRSPSQWPATLRSSASTGPLLQSRGLGDMRPCLLACPRPWHSFRASSAQMPRLLPDETTAGRNVEGLVDRFVRDPHREIARKLHRQPFRDLLRTPAGHPLTVLPVRFVLPVPGRSLRPEALSAGGTDRPAELVTDVIAQTLVREQFRGLRAPCSTLRMPLRRRSPVVQSIRPRRRVPAQLPRDRRWASSQSPSYLPHPAALRPPQRDLLTITP